MPGPYRLHGHNSRAFYSCVPDLLLCGPAGTGKTLALMLKLYEYASTYRGARCLLMRKTRASLTETGLVTWERDILGPQHPMLTLRPVMRRVRQDYFFGEWTASGKWKDTGSSLVVGGMDKPDKILSSEWDFIYLLEATDFTLNDYETLSGRIRTGAHAVAPYQQLVADCNPTSPNHWLFSRTNSTDERGRPLMLPLSSTHKDNPAYWDHVRKDWTPAGQKYVETRLRNMTGARRKRFYEGIWAAAEGLVYDGYDQKIHSDFPQGWQPPPHWRRIWAIDWGFNVPLCLQMFALDGDNRMYLYREIYRTQLRVETLARECRALVESNEEPRPLDVVTDHDPEAQATWRVHSGLPCSNAWKEDKYEGIEQTQARFDLAGDGKPRIYVVPNARRHAPDETLRGQGKPTCTVEELAAYIWNNTKPEKPKEEPVKMNDHGCDCLRYACLKVDQMTGNGMFASTGDSRDSVHGDLSNQRF